jgi:hypothetical protein
MVVFLHLTVFDCKTGRRDFDVGYTKLTVRIKTLFFPLDSRTGHGLNLGAQTAHSDVFRIFLQTVYAN